MTRRKTTFSTTCLNRDASDLFFVPAGTEVDVIDLAHPGGTEYVIDVDFGGNRERLVIDHHSLYGFQEVDA
jgi:hypothetical protein